MAASSILAMLCKGTLLMAFVVSGQQELVVGETNPLFFKHTSHMLGANPDWNYDNNGTDWNFDTCNKTILAQSPRNMNHDNSTETPLPHFETLDWNAYYFSFVTNFKPTTIAEYGAKDYVY